MRRLRIETLQPRRLMASDLAAEAIVRLNEIRFDPSQYADRAAAEQTTWWRSQSYQQPLAFNAELSASASGHAEAMATSGFFAYRNPNDGSTPNERARTAGFTLPNSVPAIGNDVELIVGGPLLDNSESLIDEVLRVDNGDTSRRDFIITVVDNLRDADEIGIGQASSANTALGQYWAIDIARREAANRFVTGVIYDDVNDNGRFDAGEGIGNSEIRSGTLTTTSDESGLYSLSLSGGNHRVIATLPSLNGESRRMVQDVRIEDDNLQVNFNVSGQTTVNFRARSLWTANVMHLDVNQDGNIQALDALNIINYLNSDEPTDLPDSPQVDDFLIDTSGDRIATALDALLVINWLNESDASSGASEPPMISPPRVMPELPGMIPGPGTKLRNDENDFLGGETPLF